jgi:hypothetical protein
MCAFDLLVVLPRISSLDRLNTRWRRVFCSSCFGARGEDAGETETKGDAKVTFPNDVSSSVALPAADGIAEISRMVGMGSAGIFSDCAGDV